MSITPGIKRETRGVGLEPTKQQKLQEAAPVPREKKKKKKKKYLKRAWFLLVKG
jgi:hypothetical protein